MDETAPTPSPPRRIAQAQLAALQGRAAPATAFQGHLHLAEGLWLSVDPQSEARLTLAPAAGGFRLTLQGGDSARWINLGCRLSAPDRAALAGAGALVIRLRGQARVFSVLGAFLRHRPTFGGLRDTGSDGALMAAPGPVEHELRIPLDPALLDSAETLELILDIRHDRLDMTLEALEVFAAA